MIRFLVHHKGLHSHHRSISKFAADLGTLLRHMQSFRVAAGFLIMLVILGIAVARMACTRLSVPTPKQLPD